MMGLFSFIISYGQRADKCSLLSRDSVEDCHVQSLHTNARWKDVFKGQWKSITGG